MNFHVSTVRRRLVLSGTVLAAAAAIATVSCGKKSTDDKNNNNNPGGWGPGSQSQIVTADLRNAVGLLVVENSGGGARLALHNETVKRLGLNAPLLNESDIVNTPVLHGFNSADADAQSPSLMKVTNGGEVKDALAVKMNENNKGGQKQALPKILTIALSPAKEVYVHFERPFLYREPPEGVDAWDQTKGYQCQIFKVKGGSVETLNTLQPEEGNLICLDNEHFINQWQTGRNSVFQFDSASNVYYPGAIPNSNKQVVYRVDKDGNNRTEMINSNICVNDFLVTKAGGVFYTGQSSCGGGGGGDGGFFRYVVPGSGVQEIARNWWNFVYEPKQATTGDTAVFFGPDPRSSSTASWNSACLFNYLPTGTDAATRVTNVITCGDNINGWINMNRAEDEATFGKGYMSSPQNQNPTDEWKAEFKSRCESSGQVFAGGGSQISSIKQTSGGDIYVIGKVRKKKAGSITCQVQVRGPHCAKVGVPLIDSLHNTSALCTADGGTWVDKGNCQTNMGQSALDRTTCLAQYGTTVNSVTINNINFGYESTNYNGVTSPLCTQAGGVSGSTWWDAANQVSITQNSATVPALPTAKFNAGWMNCSAPGSTQNGDPWTDEYTGFARVDATNKNLTLLSNVNEQAIKLWLIDDVPYYSSFNSTSSKYYLKKGDVVGGTTMIENVEVYNLNKSDNSGRLFYDGLNFGNNSYSFGTVDKAAPFATQSKSGLTGTVKTIVILN